VALRRILGRTATAAVALVVTAALLLDPDDGWSAALAEAVAPAGVPVAGLEDDDEGNVSVFLVVGSDRRDGSVTAPGTILGERADLLMLWAVPPDGPIRILGLPRDLRVHLPGRGDGKLGGVLAYGAGALVSAVRSVTGLPVHHYLELEFAALIRLVDGVGGVPLTVPYPARDRSAGLDLRAGEQLLDGATALAFARARHLEQRVAGRWVVEEGDLDRMRRQQQLLRSLLATTAERCGLLDCLDVLVGLRGSIVLDSGIGSREIRRLVTVLRRDPRPAWTSTLPTRPERPADDAVSPFPPVHLGSVGYRVMEQPAATELLHRFITGRTTGAGS
jgi:LCP family protein required for cell wall assembly